MNIGIACYPVYGGSGVVATELGKALAERGHDVHFMSYSMPFRLGHIKDNISFHEVDVNSYPLFEYPPYTLNLTSKMVDVVKHGNLDILHVHYAIPHATSAVLARQILAGEGIKIPVITTLHGTDITLVGRDPSFASIVDYSINQSDGVTAVSEYLKKETLNSCLIKADIRAIPNFIDTDQYSPLNKDHFKLALCPNGEKLLVHVSNFRPVKRVADVIQMFARLKDDGYAVKMLLVGDGPDRMATEHLARELNVMDDIRFLGKQEPVGEILSVADIFVLPSGSETFGLAALEAMSCAVPVIATDVGGLPELIQDGITGFLFPLGDVDALVDRAKQMLDNDDLRMKMAQASRKRAIDSFSKQLIVPMYESYYQEIIDKVESRPLSLEHQS
ncbi:MAG: N-acetyl-alpha-D-glucosaminyl L-malate synthase BshA [Bacteroidetes bacterium]|nr:MAG: N-acetyl-alpha-D-glucosaminyl L-malate synthase BshA [Bacteroidota bacterium]